MKNNRSSLQGDSSNQILLEALSEINREFIDPRSNKRSLFRKMLENVLSITRSEYGFIGEIINRDGAPVLKTFAITDISWNEETAALFKKSEEKGMEFSNLNTLFGYSMRTGEVVISNNPSSDPKRGGLPKGHPALKHYMGIPIKDNHNVMTGMLGIANKPGGYDESDLHLLQPMISMSAAFISAIKANEAKEFFSGTLEFYKRAIDSHAIVSVTDVHGIITYVNEKFCELAKYSPSELIGKSHFIINSGYHDKAFFQQLWSTILSGKTWQGEIRNRAKDGSIYWVAASIVPFLNEQNQPFQFVAIRNDITRLKEQERELSNFFRLSVDLLCISSKEGKILKVSESFPEALGMTEEELLKKSFLDLIHPEDRLATIVEMEKLSAGGISVDFENRYRRKDGTYLQLSWKGSMNLEDGLIYGTATDITQKKEIEEKLIRSKIEMEKARAKDIFLANMSHEIRTPLNAIAGFNELLRQTNLDREQQAHIEIIGNALKNLNVIINDILDLSKLESGKLELEKQPFCIEVLVKQVVRMHLARARAKNLKLMLSVDSEIPEYVIGDETRLSQILINLVSNAVKFTSEGGISVEVTELERVGQDVKIRFCVRDSGIGIDSSKLNMVFERFTQAEDYTTRMYGGTGLGLNIVKSLIELHKGELRVESKPGKGSEFTFEVVYPVSEKAPAELHDDPENKRMGKSLKGIKVLLVEDNEHNQILAKTFLEKEGARVEIASNGQIAIKVLDKNTFDVVLMDIQMPVMDGLQTTELIRSNLHLKMPVIGCSAHALESEKKRCLEAGMNDYITKPYSKDELISALFRAGIPGSGKEKTEELLPETLEEDSLPFVFSQWESRYGRNTTELLLNALLNRIPDDIHKIETFLKSGEAGPVNPMAHNLAGSLGGLSLREGMTIARNLEEAAKNLDRDQMLMLANKLLSYLQNIYEEAKLL